jgi:hypothetical protein
MCHVPKLDLLLIGDKPFMEIRPHDICAMPGTRPRRTRGPVCRSPWRECNSTIRHFPIQCALPILRIFRLSLLTLSFFRLNYGICLFHWITELSVDTPRHERLTALNRARDHGLDVEAVAFSTASLIAREELKVCMIRFIPARR